MNKTLKTCVMAAGLLVLAGCANLHTKKAEEPKEAVPWTGSNLQEPYPMYPCVEPSSPGNDGFMGRAGFYVYKEQALEFRKCMDEYIKNAQHDIEVIKKKMEGAAFDLRIADIQGLPDKNDY